MADREDRHAQCIPEYAVFNPVSMPSTSNYNRDMAIGVDKSEFLKIVYHKEEDSRFKTLIGLKRPAVLQRAGATTARDLYSRHLSKSGSAPALTARSTASVGKGHFLAGTAASGPKYPSLRSANDPALVKARAKARRRRKRAARQRLLAEGPRRAYSGRDGTGASIRTGSSFGSFATASTALSNATNMSFRFGGKGRVESTPFQATGFPSEKKKDAEEGPTEEMIASFAYKPDWTLSRTENYLSAVTGVEVDEERKKEINLLQEQREVLVREVEQVADKIREEELQLLEESKKKPELETIDPWAKAEAAAHAEGDDGPPEMVIDESNFRKAMVPPFLGLRYERGLKSHAKTACEVPFAAPETSRIVAGRWRKRNENMQEAQYGFYSPPGEEPFYLKTLGSKEEMHRKPGKRHLMTLLEQPHNNLYPLFSKK